jgi:polysaccharide export outer membrane protein
MKTRRYAINRLYGILAVAVVLTAGIAHAQETSGGGSGEYIIGVEDMLSISIWREPDLATAVRVRPDGKITFPLVGDIQAEGRTSRQLTADIADALKTFIKEPVVTVIVDEINSFKVYVLGEVNTQGELLLRRRTRFLEAIALAGGLTEYAEESNVILIRNEGGRDTRTKVDYRQVVKGTGSASNFYLKPGDTIIVN